MDAARPVDRRPRARAHPRATGALVVLAAAAVLGVAGAVLAVVHPWGSSASVAPVAEVPGPPPTDGARHAVVPVELTPAPAPAAAAPPSAPTADPVSAPVYAVVYHVAIPAHRIDAPVISVGVVNGAMDAPEGQPNDPVWRDGFWLNRTVPLGHPGVATVAGHLDDTLGRPAGFWNLRDVVAGDDVYVTSADGSQRWHYRVTSTEVDSVTYASTPAVLDKLFGAPMGSAGDGVPRLSLITCTGTFVRPTGYDHRFIAYAQLVA